MMPSILVVEDNRVYSQVITKVLRTIDGYVPEPVETAEAALEHLESHRADLVLVDIILPGRDGIWLIQQLSAQQPNLPTLVLSGTDGYYRDQAIQAGARGYVAKQDVAGLLDAIKAVLNGGTYLSDEMPGGHAPTTPP